MTAAQRITEALAAVRKANAIVDTVRVNEFVLSSDEQASELSLVRIELSCAAAHLAYVLDAVPNPQLSALNAQPRQS